MYMYMYDVYCTHTCTVHVCTLWRTCTDTLSLALLLVDTNLYLEYMYIVVLVTAISIVTTDLQYENLIY